MINYYSIYCASICLASCLPQILYFLIKGRKSLPPQLLHGCYLLVGLIAILSAIASCVVLLFFSTDFGTINRFFLWQLTSHLGVSLVFLSWILFIMHGYEARYLFRKILLPAHMNVLIVIIFLASALFPLNLWALIPVSIFIVSSLIWSIKAYYLTKPPIDENVPLRENDDL